MESIAHIFHIDWKILIAQTANFCLVTFVLWRYVFRPVSKTLKERTEKIDRGLSMAEESKKKLIETGEEVKKLLGEAKSESQRIITKASEEAKNLRDEELKTARMESERIIESGKRSLLLEKENIIRSIRGEAADILVQASKSVLKDVATPEIDRDLAEKALSKIE